MRKLIIALVVASASLVPGVAVSQTTATAPAESKDLQADAPSEYVVQKGDTLWAISGRFLKEPWRWPQIWQMNREQIKNPHLIYPGDIIRLDRSGASPTLALVAGAGAADGLVRLQPRTRIESLSAAIPSIPGTAIGPFLSQPLILDPGTIDTYPVIVATEEERVVIGAGNLAYVAGLQPGDPITWQIFRSGDALTDPDTGELLGYEAIHVGDAKVRKFGSPSTIEITRARQEINPNDRLMPAREVTFPTYMPRAPEKQLAGRILAVRGSVSDISQYSIVAINRGSRDGMEVGHVLATMRKGQRLGRNARPSLLSEFVNSEGFDVEVKPNPVVPDTKVNSSSGGKPMIVIDPSEPVVLPDERSGLLFVFRTFEKVSYGMIMKATRPIFVGDVVRTP